MVNKKRNWLFKIRKDANLTQEAVAQKAKINRSTYTKIENGAPIKVSTAKSIAAVFNIDWTLFFENNCSKYGQN